MALPLAIESPSTLLILLRSCLYNKITRCITLLLDSKADSLIKLLVPKKHLLFLLRSLDPYR